MVFNLHYIRKVQKMSKKRNPVLSVIIVILLLLIIAAALITNLVFTLSSTPHLFGYYVTIQEDDSMEPDINQGTAVISKAIDNNTALTAGTKILCRLNDGTTAIRYISSVEDGDNGNSTYVPAVIKSDSTESELAISKSNILAVCTVKSDEFATFIKFTRSFYGIAAFLILPCIILVIMLVVSITRTSRSERYEDEDAFEKKYSSKKNSDDSVDTFDDEFFDDEYDEPSYSGGYAEQNISNTTRFDVASELERKKSSIARNFERKRVDTNSPYQKAVERERTMQFKAQKDSGFADYSTSSLDGSDMTPRYAGSVAEAKTAPINPDKHSAVGAFPETIKVANYNTAYDTAHMGAHEVISEDNVVEEEDAIVKPYTPEHEQGIDVEREEPVRKPHEKPNLDDILKSTSKGDSDYIRPSHDDISSIDELISVIENEKKKIK